MLIGLCASMISPVTDPAGVECIEPLAELGFDYIELSLAHLVEMTPERLASVKSRLRDAGLPCRSCNNFFPPRIRLTGPDHDLAATLHYAARALDVAASLGAEYVVFGSSGAKNLPPGVSPETGRQQVVALLKHLGPLAEDRRLTLVIEPISRPEANFILTAREGLQLAREVDHPHVRLLVDYYHLKTEREPDDIISTAGSTIKHLHIGAAGDRRFPMTADAELLSFFRRLHGIEYAGGLSIEAYTEHFRNDAALAVKCLRQAWAETGG